MQPEMPPQRFETPVIVQRRMAVLHADHADDQVNGLADRGPFATQGTIIVRRLHRDLRVKHVDDVERV